MKQWKSLCLQSSPYHFFVQVHEYGFEKEQLPFEINSCRDEATIPYLLSLDTSTILQGVKWQLDILTFVEMIQTKLEIRQTFKVQNLRKVQIQLQLLLLPFLFFLLLLLLQAINGETRSYVIYGSHPSLSQKFYDSGSKWPN